MDIYFQVKHRLQAPILARKFDLSDWFPCGADRRAYGHVITKISRMTDNQIFLRMVLRYKFIQCKGKCPTHLSIHRN